MGDSSGVGPVVRPQHLRNIRTTPKPSAPGAIMANDHRRKRTKLYEANSGRCHACLEEMRQITDGCEGDLPGFRACRKHFGRKQEFRGVLIRASFRIVIRPFPYKRAICTGESDL